MKPNRIFLIIGLLIAVSLACASGGSSEADETAAAIRTEIAAGGGDTENGLGPNIETVQAQQTQDAAIAQETQAALDAQNAGDVAATEQAVAPILAELPTYGVSPDEGRIAWIHPPETLEISGYLQYDYKNRFAGTVATDFVVSTDITWDTSGGLAGCGFALRADGNVDALNSYLAIASRGGNGRVEFASIVEGELKNFKDLYAYGIDPNFQWQNNTTNTLAIVGRGGTFEVYTNGVKIGEIMAGDPPPRPNVPAPPAGAPQTDIDAYNEALNASNASYQAQLAAYSGDVPFFEKGFIAMLALSESGITNCQFDNTWLFLIEN
ncbi:MAG: hypothetical protein DWQ07_01720 [Chloroflexi bacterium]|nr:MAG: hypothetical protein DWQ07_01720 [Chloroflexota bacterium]MBL1193784.1 hypothetical protein [Chloroflexota bacterium]NOH11077.1 hypothetical protein [Chloroflexota bacterium]